MSHEPQWVRGLGAKPDNRQFGPDYRVQRKGLQDREEKDKNSNAGWWRKEWKITNITNIEFRRWWCQRKLQRGVTTFRHNIQSMYWTSLYSSTSVISGTGFESYHPITTIVIITHPLSFSSGHVVHVPGLLNFDDWDGLASQSPASIYIPFAPEDLQFRLRRLSLCVCIITVFPLFGSYFSWVRIIVNNMSRLLSDINSSNFTSQSRPPEQEWLTQPADLDAVIPEAWPAIGFLYWCQLKKTAAYTTLCTVIYLSDVPEKCLRDAKGANQISVSHTISTILIR